MGTLAHLRLGGCEDCPGHEHNQDPGHHGKQGAEDARIGEAAHWCSLGTSHKRLYGGRFRLFTRWKQAG
jgi:hypothetical protein